MSLFFDVWCDDGFVLGSDVRLSGGESKFLHKLFVSGKSSRVTCAVAVCGDYPEVAIHFFVDACARKAVSSVGAILELAKHEKRAWTANDLANLVSQCLVFLANVGNILMASSSVGLSPDQQRDVVILRPGSIETVRWANFN